MTAYGYLNSVCFQDLSISFLSILGLIIVSDFYAKILGVQPKILNSLTVIPAIWIITSLGYLINKKTKLKELDLVEFTNKFTSLRLCILVLKITITIIYLCLLGYEVVTTDQADMTKELQWKFALEGIFGLLFLLIFLGLISQNKKMDKASVFVTKKWVRNIIVKGEDDEEGRDIDDAFEFD